MKQTFRFFRERDCEQEIVQIEGQDEWEIADNLDASWDEEDRSSRWDAVENYYGKLE